jgi:alkylation response protein AidB-like acyl-CoA dehydrogenase
MSLAVTEDHRLLGETARAVLARQGGTAAARDVTDTGSNKLPAGWDELVGLGWLGLAVPERFEGQGYGIDELAVVLDELGRCVTPGPFLPTVWAAAVLTRCGDEAQCQAYLPDLVSGRRHGAVGLGGEIVLGGGWADIVLLVDGDDVVIVERGPGIGSEVLDSLDRTRPLARVTGTAAGRLVGAAGTALDLGRTLAAAEAAGLAAACLDAANAYAKEREQFGRVIGGFQAVKHHLANMLVDTELATAAAWDAARAASAAPGTEGAGVQFHLAAVVAAVEVFEAAMRVVKKSIQVHGGIGFTWDHDAHLYLRRITVLRGLIADQGDPASELAELVRAGVRRSDAVDLPSEAEAYRSEAAAFLTRLQELPEDQRRLELVSSGYLVPHWPTPWGRAAGPVEQLVIDEVLSEVERPNLGIGGWVTLTITQHGTEDQLTRWVLPSLRGELNFCQMFSEPNAGSDAAAIKSRATRVEGGWLVNGQKVWTSGAHLANRGFATVRTDPEAPKHQGVTMMVIDLTHPGVDIRPLRQITGEAHFNEVFFTDVFVPDDDVVGPVGAGWTVARSTLGNERVSIGGGAPFATPAADLAGASPPDGRYDRELGVLIAEGQAQRDLQLRLVTRAVTGGEPGPEGNVTKLVSGELAQRTSDLALRMAGVGALTVGAANPVFDYLNTLCLTIAGGTSEIVRNQIGERILGLPREPLLR